MCISPNLAYTESSEFRISRFIYLFIIYAPFDRVRLRPLWAYSAGNNHHLCFHWTPVNKTKFKVKFIFILSV